VQRTTQLIYGIYDKEYYSQYEVEVVTSRFFFCEEEVPAAITGLVFRRYGLGRSGFIILKSYCIAYPGDCVTFSLEATLVSPLT
jgi:hypothetical protein